MTHGQKTVVRSSGTQPDGQLARRAKANITRLFAGKSITYEQERLVDSAAKKVVVLVRRQPGQYASDPGKALSPDMIHDFWSPNSTTRVTSREMPEETLKDYLPAGTRVLDDKGAPTTGKSDSMVTLVIIETDPATRVSRSGRFLGRLSRYHKPTSSRSDADANMALLAARDGKREVGKTITELSVVAAATGIATAIVSFVANLPLIGKTVLLGLAYIKLSWDWAGRKAESLLAAQHAEYGNCLAV